MSVAAVTGQIEPWGSALQPVKALLSGRRRGLGGLNVMDWPKTCSKQAIIDLLLSFILSHDIWSCVPSYDMYYAQLPAVFIAGRTFLGGKRGRAQALACSLCEFEAPGVVFAACIYPPSTKKVFLQHA